MTLDTHYVVSTFDPRFSFHILVPQHSYGNADIPLVVLVHGINRDVEGYLDGMRNFCLQHSCVVLCPLFPEGVPHSKQKNSYKDLLSHGTRFDIILFSMIAQAGENWSVRTDRFYLHGFSAGGQFVHRFAYLYPDRLLAVSIGSPGRLTAPDVQCPWPEGIGNVKQAFALPDVDFTKLAQIPVQFVVGEKDVGTKMIENMNNPTRFEIEAGKTRLERIKWLKASWERMGISLTELTVVAGVGHDGIKCLPAVGEWFGRMLKHAV